MKKTFIYPDYYSEFHCIADKCPDSCCEEWEIVVDDETADLYEEVTGDIGEKLRNSMTIDDDGDRIFTLEGKRCPFHEKSGLCEIQRLLGEEYLCDTCREYPRAVQDCGDFAECDLSLSCPEAARIILSKKNEPEYLETEENVLWDEACYDKGVMEFMKYARRQLLDIIWDRSETVSQAVRKCGRYSLALQERLDGNEISIFPYSDDMPCAESISFSDFSYGSLINSCLNGEILTEEFRIMLKDALSLGETPMNAPEYSDAAKAIDSFNDLHRQLCTHYINRYWLRAAFDGEAAEKMLILIKAFALIRRFELAYFVKNKELPFSAVVRIVQLYSKETEHNTD
ncbi:MAG: flagellin lysine-N-methylase [Ruminococcus sp.]